MMGQTGGRCRHGGDRRRDVVDDPMPPARNVTLPRPWRIPLLVALLVLGIAVPACSAPPPYVREDCDAADRAGHTVARIWDEQALALIRQVVPAPTVHARNLFHLSVAMWDAWAAYASDADGYAYVGKHEASDVMAAREVTMSFAAYRILDWRYRQIADL